MIDKNIPIILASASPRRKQLLEQAGFSFTVTPSTVEETISEDTPDRIAESLAFQKANDVYQQIKPDYAGRDFCVIGADTIVYYDKEILGKPQDEQEAFDMLKMLADRTHQVYTGMAVIMRTNGEKCSLLFHDRTDVTFYPIDDYELKNYIATGDCMDKAGSYGIQGAFAIHIKEICGDYNNVVGLPISKLYQALKEW